MTPAKPPGEKHVSRHFMLPPDIAAAIDPTSQAVAAIEREVA